MSSGMAVEVVIAVQLGVNHTSNACMIKHNPQKECKDFNVPFDTPSIGMSITIPTVALFDDKGAIQSYGFEAELQHMQLDKTSNHLLFREFISDLFCSNETVPENLIAVNKKQMKSIDVATAVLGHMINHIKTKSGLQRQSFEFEYMYVLTLPTCSCIGSKTFMEEAALKAGCLSGNIKIVEETAAILQFCLNNKEDENIKLLDDLCDRKFLVVECGEKNATMSVLHLINENTIKILIKENTGCHFVEMIGLKDFFEKYPLEYYDFLREVKSKIKLMSTNCSELYINTSAVKMDDTRSFGGMQESDLRTGTKDELRFKRDKCVIKSKRFQILLTEAGKSIVDYIEKQLFTKFPDINEIILAGEFAQSPILQNIIKTSFSAKNVIIPFRENMAAVRGAVFFGQDRVSVVTDIVPDMQHTHLTNAQVALPKALSKKKRLKKIMLSDGTPSSSKSKESSKQKLCVVL